MDNKHQEWRDFDALLFEAIDEELSSISLVLRDKIYNFLEKDFGMKKEEIPSRLEEFSTAVKVMLGPGAMPLEILFMKQFHKKIAVKHKWVGPTWLIPDLSFQTYVEMKKQGINRQKRIGELDFWVNVENRKKRTVEVKTQKAKR